MLGFRLSNLYSISVFFWVQRRPLLYLTSNRSWLFTNEKLTYNHSLLQMRIVFGSSKRFSLLYVHIHTFIFSFLEHFISFHILYVFYKHSVFQSEARICLRFLQIQPQNMLKICLSKNIHKTKFHDLNQMWGVWVGSISVKFTFSIGNVRLKR